MIIELNILILIIYIYFRGWVVKFLYNDILCVNFISFLLIVGGF